MVGEPLQTMRGDVPVIHPVPGSRPKIVQVQSNGLMVQSDGVESGVGYWVIWEMAPDFWTDSLTWLTWPG